MSKSGLKDGSSPIKMENRYQLTTGQDEKEGKESGNGAVLPERFAKN